MLRLCLVALILGCGSSGMGTPDGGGGDDTAGDGGGSNMPNTPRTVKLTLNNRPMNAGNFTFLVAYQDGSAPWQLAPAPTGDTYSFEIHAPSYGVAYTCIGMQTGTTNSQLRTVVAAHFAVGERTELSLDVPARCSDRGNTNTLTLSGTVTNRPWGGFSYVAWGSRTAAVGSQTGNFQLQAEPGTHDLFVIHAVSVGNGDFYTDEVWVARDVTLDSSGTRQINFNEARPTQQLAVDVSTVVDPNARVNATTTLYTANGTAALLVRETTNHETQSLSANQAKTTDIYDQSITVSTLGRGATITHATSTPGDQVWAAPPAMGQAQTTVAAKTPYAMLQTLWPAYAGAQGYIWNGTQQLASAQCGGNLPCTISWSAILSPGVTGMMPGYQMPDLSMLTGWKSAFALVPGQQAFGSVTAYTSSAGASDFPPGIPANGTNRTFVRADYAVTP